MKVIFFILYVVNRLLFSDEVIIELSGFYKF